MKKHFSYILLCAALILVIFAFLTTNNSSLVRVLHKPAPLNTSATGKETKVDTEASAPTNLNTASTASASHESTRMAYLLTDSDPLNQALVRWRSGAMGTYSEAKTIYYLCSELKRLIATYESDIKNRVSDLVLESSQQQYARLRLIAMGSQKCNPVESYDDLRHPASSDRSGARLKTLLTDLRDNPSGFRNLNSTMKSLATDPSTSILVSNDYLLGIIRKEEARNGANVNTDLARLAINQAQREFMNIDQSQTDLLLISACAEFLVCLPQDYELRAKHIDPNPNAYTRYLSHARKFFKKE